MADLAKVKARLLKEHNFVLVRQTKHLVYRNPEGRVYVESSTPSDRYALNKQVADLRRILSSPPQAEILAIEAFEKARAQEVRAALDRQNGSAPKWAGGRGGYHKTKDTGFYYVSKEEEQARLTAEEIAIRQAQAEAARQNRIRKDEQRRANKLDRKRRQHLEDVFVEKATNRWMPRYEKQLHAAYAVIFREYAELAAHLDEVFPDALRGLRTLVESTPSVEFDGDDGWRQTVLAESIAKSVMESAGPILSVSQSATLCAARSFDSEMDSALRPFIGGEKLVPQTVRQIAQDILRGLTPERMRQETEVVRQNAIRDFKNQCDKLAKATERALRMWWREFLSGFPNGVVKTDEKFLKMQGAKYDASHRLVCNVFTNFTVLDRLAVDVEGSVAEKEEAA